ncbi:MAG: DUF262 domain-containing protein [Muribaculum sp.]|nr:DUF262 domain-containing protein [Muribaculum sp.]
MGKDNHINLNESKPQPVPIGILCKERFFIPSYQRGYKWSKTEVELLLNDMYNYNPCFDGSFYCLQPVVVRYDSEREHWRVIDGQQRLTTIFLILKLIQNEESEIFVLDYERETHIDKLCGSSIQIDSSTSETYYLTTAFEVIDRWLGDRNTGERAARKEKLRNILLSQTKVIWYHLKTPGQKPEQSLQIEHEYFMNLNSGKISLTESELIKALLLHKRNDTFSEMKQLYMAEEWNRMERQLRQPDVWYFIAGRQPLPENSMDFLLSILWNSKPKTIREKFEENEYPIFLWAENNDTQKVWDELILTYRKIIGWYEDCQLHNIIGYYASKRGRGNGISSLLQSESKTRKEFIQKLWEDALNELGIITVDTQSKHLSKNYHDYRYDKNYDKIFNVLLLANIVLASIEGIPRRFDFRRFNDLENPWNVEHITPRTPKNNAELLKMLRAIVREREEERNLYEIAGKDIPTILETPPIIFDLIKLLEKIDSIDNLDLQTLKGLTEEEANHLGAIKSDIIPSDEEETMPIKNLTLLSERCNKGIGNRFFFDKRHRLIEYQSTGQFIPQLTMNVFSKWYSTKETAPWFWSADDRNDYEVALDRLFTKAIDSLTGIL